jgi:hypothetical protein
MIYRIDWQECPTHRRAFCQDSGCRTQRSRAASGYSAGTSPALGVDTQGDLDTDGS